jgi:ADP-L-glycero-D-manno-heptose 6-epimerase
MNILITGGAGFIGSNLAYELKRRYPDCKLTIFDKFNTGEKRFKGNYKYFGDYNNLIDLDAEIIVGDLLNKKDIDNLLQSRFDVIYHQAAISDTTELNQNEMINTNSNSFDLFLKYSLDFNSKLIYASSAGTYGNTLPPNIVGIGEYPENVYGFSKLLMDQKFRRILLNRSEPHIVGLRYFNVYGHGELYKRKTSSMILQLAKQAIDNNSVRLFKFGEHKRDFVYIKDVVDANINAIQAKPGIYNVGSGVSRSFNDIISILKNELNREISIDYFDNPYSFYQCNTCADLSTNLNGLDYNPNYNLEDGIKDYLKKIINYSTKEWSLFYEG